MTQFSRAKPVLKWTGIVLAALILVLGLVIVFMDWNALRGPVARTMSARLGRPVTIEGALDVQFRGGTPRITVDDLVVGHPKWIGEGIMAHIERVTLDVRLLPLLAGRLVLPLVHIERPEFYLVRNAQGNGNWELKEGK